MKDKITYPCLGTVRPKQWKSFSITNACIQQSLACLENHNPCHLLTVEFSNYPQSLQTPALPEIMTIRLRCTHLSRLGLTTSPQRIPRQVSEFLNRPPKYGSASRLSVIILSTPRLFKHSSGTTLVK